MMTVCHDTYYTPPLRRDRLLLPVASPPWRRMPCPSRRIDAAAPSQLGILGCDGAATIDRLNNFLRLEFLHLSVKMARMALVIAASGAVPVNQANWMDGAPS